MTDQVSQQVSLDRLRAKFANEFVSSAIQGLGTKGAKKYRQLARSAPADIMTSGFGQTIAFWAAKDEPHHKDLLKHLSSWLENNQIAIKSDDTELLQWVTTLPDSATYVLARNEALAILSWIKRFAEARIWMGD